MRRLLVLGLAGLALAGCGSASPRTARVVATTTTTTKTERPGTEVPSEREAATILRRGGEESAAHISLELEAAARSNQIDGFGGGDHLYDIRSGIHISDAYTEMGPPIRAAQQENENESRGMPVEHMTALWHPNPEEPPAVIWFRIGRNPDAPAHWHILGWDIADQGFDAHYRTAAEQLRQGEDEIRREDREAHAIQQRGQRESRQETRASLSAAIREGQRSARESSTSTTRTVTRSEP